MSEPRGRAVKLFAGAGGSCLGAKAAGIEGPGIELDPVICRTRRAAGLETIEGSVLDYGPADVPDATGLVGTPPCQLFSTAGTGEARKLMPEILAAVAAMGRGEKPDTEGWPIGALLVLEPLRWIIEAVNLGRPYEWIVLEQVPPVLPIWQAYGEVLSAGYGVAAANLQAECWGVPQTRKRAIFVARLGRPAKLPTPTHSRYYPRDPKRLDAGVLPWVSMADALGEEWSDASVRSNYGSGGDSSARGVRHGGEPFATVTSKFGRNKVAMMPAGRSCPGNPRLADEPASTITGMGNQVWVNADDYAAVQAGTSAERRAMLPADQETVPMHYEDAAVIQSFPRGYPWQGKAGERDTQIGNSAPPLLVEAVVRALLED